MDQTQDHRQKKPRQKCKWPTFQAMPCKGYARLHAREMKVKRALGETYHCKRCRREAPRWENRPRPWCSSTCRELDMQDARAAKRAREASREQG